MKEWVMNLNDGMEESSVSQQLRKVDFLTISLLTVRWTIERRES